MTDDTATASKSFFSRTKDGQLYLHKLVKLLRFWNPKTLSYDLIPRFTIFRCLPNGQRLPRIRMSKKDRLKLKRALQCPSSSPSSNDSSALQPSTSPA